jgi:hypothetical protein
MSRKVVLDVMFLCEDHAALLRSLVTQGLISADRPTKLLKDGFAHRVPDDWIGLPLNDTLRASWPDDSLVYVIDRDLVKISTRNFELDMVGLLEQLSGVEFEMANVGKVFWWDNPNGPAYEAPESSVGRAALGSATAYRGRGHGRAISRRWIERGPWRVLRGKNDTTLTQFHEEDVEMSTALEQARRCHVVMSDETQAPLPTRKAYGAGELTLSGTWVEPTREFVVSVAGREPGRRELREAVALRFFQLLGPDQPVDKVVYSFMDEKELKAVIDDLWLYDMEARLRDASGWHRRDDRYVPPPAHKPSWIEKLGRDDRFS